MPDPRTFYGSATVGTKGQIVIPVDARRAMGVKAGDRVVVVRGPRDGTISVIGVEAFEGLLARLAELDEHAPV
jgi:AbrB family looped-hinge helix DNA binding protein